MGRDKAAGRRRGVGGQAEQWRISGGAAARRNCNGSAAAGEAGTQLAECLP